MRNTVDSASTYCTALRRTALVLRLHARPPTHPQNIDLCVAMGRPDISVEIVRLPTLWGAVGGELWNVESSLTGASKRAGASFRDVVRRTSSFESSGERREFTCLSQHGLERRSIYALFLHEMRRLGVVGRAAAAKRLFLVPVVPIPPSVNASVRTLLSMGLQEAVLRSVTAHPSPGPGPNHFMLVARVCSCFISGDRRPHLGKRARDECQPFPRAGRTLELSQAVRVLSYEQVTRGVAARMHALTLCLRAALYTIAGDACAGARRGEPACRCAC